MKISQTIEVGHVNTSYVSSLKSDNEVELYAGDDKVVFTMSEEVMMQLHKKLGEKLTQIADERLDESQQMMKEESSEDE